MRCTQVIDLQKPVETRWVGGVHRRLVSFYRCPSCAARRTVRVTDVVNGRPVIESGWIVCGRERYLPGDHAACRATGCPKASTCLRTSPEPGNERQSWGHSLRARTVPTTYRKEARVF